MYVDMWVDLLKQLHVDEKYHYLSMEGLDGLFRVYWGVQEPY